MLSHNCLEGLISWCVQTRSPLWHASTTCPRGLTRRGSSHCSRQCHCKPRRGCAHVRRPTWVTAPPMAAVGLHLQAPQFRTAIRLWLGLPTGPEGVCDCGAPCDAQGTHALHCKLGGGPVKRHNNLRDVVFSACRTAGLLPELEKTGVLPGGSSGLLSRWPGGGAYTRCT